MTLLDLLELIAATHTHLAPLVLPEYTAPLGDLDTIRPLVLITPTPADTTVLGVYPW
ncbi:Uncharacterised protein [Mycobacteroides abscessus subsp. abscessus]|nr:Uncharacterised protein [Mycobacteroides abscessus subsp. abscessus]